ncbi:MAG: radical SAM protein, partial [Acidimicrobiales bacterium]|nr:radical SAM protein [Acidimicrobiales bacterium]
KVYGESFFSDLEAIIPNLQEVSFTGGEPFLVPEYYRIWDMIAELNPDLPCRITTNGTQWSARVERVLSTLRCEINVSIDGYTKETYESVRVGADHATVFANLERFVASCRTRGTPLSIYHCLMPQNYHELGDLLLLGDRLDVDVQVCVVQVPLECSLEAMDDWTDLRATFDRFAETVRPQLGRNGWVFDDQYKRVVEGGLLNPVLGFPRISSQVLDDAQLAAAAGWGPGDLPESTIALGSDERIAAVSPAMAALAQVPVDALVGRSLEALDEAMTAAYGERSEMHAGAGSDDMARTETTYGSSRFRSTLVARRKPDGWLTHVELVVERLD